MIYFIIISILLVLYFLYQQNEKNKRLELERLEQERIRLETAEAKRLKEKAIVEGLHSISRKFNDRFNKFLSFQEGYFNNNKLSTWKADAESTINELKKYKIENLRLDSKTEYDIKQLQTNYITGDAIRKNYNNKFIQHELNETKILLSNIEGQSLDEQQRLAVIKDEDNNLVIAGAGSGKTTTVAGKVAYVIDRFKVKPEEILLITYTKKASDEMRHRIKDKMNIDIEVNTFHSFGRKVIGAATNNMPAVIDDDDFQTQMKNIFNTLFEDTRFSSNVIRFMTEYRLETKEDNDFKSHGEYIDYLKNNNIRSYKKVSETIKGVVTLLRQTCKSREEVQIANFLFLNGVDYRYEEPYKHKTSDNKYSQYKPDFYLPGYDIYIEHFGLIDRNNNVPKWFSSGDNLSAKEKYNSDIEWKLNKHQEHQTTLIKTYSYENKEGVLLEKLKKNLEAHGVVFNRRSNEEIWEIINSVADEEISSLDTLIKTFLNLFKSNNFKIEDLIARIQLKEKGNTNTRHLLFLDIFSPILTNYNYYLKSKNLMDFSDMINDASDHIAKNRYLNKFKYIIIDEFQDTSVGRFNLIKSLINNNRSCKLFAVGDDWQSIYRFAGSDISLFTEFEKFFGVTEFSKIETTYRFSKSMIDLSSKFILANPNQTTKELKAFGNNILNPVEIIVSESYKNDDPHPLIKALVQIKFENSERNSNLKILAISRYNHIIDLYKKRTDLFKVRYDTTDKSYFIKYLEFQELEVQFMSVHRSKGLQGDYIIILNCVSGQYGFPSEQADDPILNLLLSKADQFENGEERRLFYVALTRAKNKTFITTNSSYKSKFINEIDPNYIEDPSIICPICKKGNVLKQEGIDKNGNPFIRSTCSNWNYGCEYLSWG